MLRSGWLVRFAPAELPSPVPAMSFVAGLPGGWPQWLERVGIPPGTPYLLSPGLEYDVAANAFFRSPQMISLAWNTQAGYARDVAAFLTFLWSARGRRSWRDATEDDHLAYLVWRRRDERGPRVSGSTWDREVAAVNGFYGWQVRAGNTRTNPIPSRPRRVGRSSWRSAEAGDAPATYSHDRAAERMEWLTPTAYRRWRDIGMRGFGPAGLPDPGFRGRWAARNATFCDLMVRTGLRLSEQAGLSVFEMPVVRSAAGGYQRFWLPPALAKGGSARWVYVPASVVTELASYAEIDRAEVIAQARADGRYSRIRRPLVIEDPDRPVAIARHDGVRTSVKLAQLGLAERRRLLVEDSAGLEPAMFWLSEAGLPITVSTWKNLFRQANQRCQARGLGELRAHPHQLRHTFAVLTLEQLQRGHITALAELTPDQRSHYTRVFGDPLDWVRRRLGHRSVATTQIYLHALAELEMTTRIALIPDGWQDPQQHPAVAALTEAGVDSPGERSPGQSLVEAAR